MFDGTTGDLYPYFLVAEQMVAAGYAIEMITSIDH